MLLCQEIFTLSGSVCSINNLNRDCDAAMCEIMNEKTLILLSVFLCYNLLMGCRTYEADKEGRITIYPSLDGPTIRGRGILRAMIKKLLNRVSTIGKGSTSIPKT